MTHNQQFSNFYEWNLFSCTQSSNTNNFREGTQQHTLGFTVYAMFCSMVPLWLLLAGALNHVCVLATCNFMNTSSNGMVKKEEVKKIPEPHSSKSNIHLRHKSMCYLLRVWLWMRMYFNQMDLTLYDALVKHVFAYRFHRNIRKYISFWSIFYCTCCNFSTVWNYIMFIKEKNVQNF